LRPKKQSSQLSARALVRATAGTSFPRRYCDHVDQSKPRRTPQPGFSQYPHKTSGYQRNTCKFA
jgi:hypothetical protein